jgi:hypothetical protein
MLDSFVIEEIRRRERLRQDRQRPPAVELPLPSPEMPPHRRSEEPDDGEERPQRGVVVIDL